LINNRERTAKLHSNFSNLSIGENDTKKLARSVPAHSPGAAQRMTGSPVCHGRSKI
uniref:Uncharacterized protein n=1 Tax=Oryza brachyantha TaxID=4533 RepID=J3LPS1_ORYBR